MSKVEDHAKFPPSASHRWINCPGSIALAPPDESDGKGSVYAWEGTICHSISAQCLKENKRAEEFAQQIVEGVEITPELVDAIQMYVDEVKSTAVELGTKGGRIETEVEITPDCWGTVDATLWNEDTLAIIDAKFGKGVIVEAEGNTQLMTYAVGILKALKAEGNLPKNIVLKIVQPRTVNPVRECLTTIVELQAWAKDVLAPAIERLRSGTVDCKAGEWCKWCPVVGCVVQARANLDLAAEAFQPFTTAEAPEIATSGNVLELEAMAKLALSFKDIEDWMSSIREKLTALALAGEDVPYWKMVAGRSVRKWDTEETELVEFLRGHEIEPYKEVLETAPAIEKKIGKKKAAEIGLDDHIIKPEGNPTLVPETDKRPAIEKNIEKQFEEFVEKDSGPVLVVDKEDAPEMSLMQRLMAANGSESVSKPEPEPEPEPEIATGGNAEVEESTKPKKNPTPPTAPKRKQVLDLIQNNEGITLAEVALEVGITENSVRMHIRYLHERDGFGFRIYTDGRVEILT